MLIRKNYAEMAKLKQEKIIKKEVKRVLKPKLKTLGEILYSLGISATNIYIVVEMERRKTGTLVKANIYEKKSENRMFKHSNWFTFYFKNAPVSYISWELTDYLVYSGFIKNIEDQEKSNFPYKDTVIFKIAEI